MKETKNLTLWDVAMSVDELRIELAGALDAMSLLGEAFYDEGFQYEEHFDNSMAINFVKRFPMHLSMFEVISRDIGRIAEELKGTANRAYDAYKTQREADI